MITQKELIDRQLALLRAIGGAMKVNDDLEFDTICSSIGDIINKRKRLKGPVNDDLFILMNSAIERLGQLKTGETDE